MATVEELLQDARKRMDASVEQLLEVPDVGPIQLFQ